MTDRVRGRVIVLLCGVLLSAGAIGARLVFLQVVRCDKLRSRAGNQHWREIEVPATRGAVLDREGRELALSLATESFFAHPRRVKEPERAARLLAPVLGESAPELLARLRSDKPFVYLERSLDPERAAAVRALDLPIGNSLAFGFHPSFKRYYPQGRLAVHVIGFANIDGRGIEGIERQFDEDLRGEPAHYVVMQDGNNGLVQQKEVDLPEKQPSDVVLTIDLVLQHVVERELDRALEDTGASAASAIVLDPVSGDVLALANRPAADPNHYGTAGSDERTNRALVHQYEPGSTFKVVTLAAALEHGRVELGQVFDCEQGSYSYHGRLIRDIARHGALSTREIFETSSNVGMVKIVQRLGAQDLYETIEHFGFGRRAGIELPGELPGKLEPVSAWNGQTQTSLAFGYEVGVTVLQMASALATIANEGERMPPRIVLGLRGADGRFHPEARPSPERAIDARTARTMGDLMEGVVLRGTGTRAKVPGYRVAGKSGTARKIVDGQYSSTQFIASFGGFAPRTAPRLVALVVLDSPRGGEAYGGLVAAPVFLRIMGDALTRIRAPQDDDVMTVASRRPQEHATRSATP